MHRVHARRLALSMFLLASSELKAWQLETQFHEGLRTQPKQIFYPPTPSLPSRSGLEAIARRYLREQRAQLGIPRGTPLPKLVDQRKSLLGTHFRFQQEIGELAVDKAQIVVTVLPSGKIFQVYNTLLDLPAPRSGARLTEEEAYDRAWEALRVDGPLFQEPRARLVYSVDEARSQLHPVYQIELSTTAPFGVWKIVLDAVDGKILELSDARVSHRPRSAELPTAEEKHLGPSVKRREAFAAWAAQSKLKKAKEQASRSFRLLELTAGQAQVFDPDPRSTLGRRELEDDSPASDFLLAYQRRILPEVTFDGEAYRLEGPFAKIVDFAPPEAPPSGSPDGRWIFQRGEMGFNEAMSYFHIDQNQRYLQSLGFKGVRGIQQRPIEIDANGAGDENSDNSFYDPTTNRLGFGHGCVDDNEDADVILHEYGHAIQLDINPAWSGGDSGAIGEGFGDYWAASYSLSTGAGASYFPEEVFSWDGQGSGRCWPGRILNALGARYEHSRLYEAHMLLDGGFQSNELWSTPLFQALLSLKAQGIPREEVDRIIVEAHFGLGAGVKMRDLAQATVAVAAALYPDGPHAAVFREKFLAHEILREPRPKLEMTLIDRSDSGGSGSLEPGEDESLRLKIENKGDRAAQAVELKLSSTDPAVLALIGSVSIPELDVGASMEVLLSFQVAPEALCGASLRYQVELTREGQPDASLPFETRLGQGRGFKVEAFVDAAIPDALAEGLSSKIRVPSVGPVSEQLQIGIVLRHSYRGDLKLTLLSPEGRRIILHDKAGYSADDIIGVYPLTLSSKDPLSTLIGESLYGDWELKVEDTSLGDEGRLESWSISDTNAYVCQ